jgi:hypothetical protein
VAGQPDAVGGLRESVVGRVHGRGVHRQEDGRPAARAGGLHSRTIEVLDQRGVHLADLQLLLGLLDELVGAGKSIIVIEHHQAVMAHADRIIELGPGAGHDGGRVVFEGTPADLAPRSTQGCGVGLRLAHRVAQVCNADARDHSRVAKDGWRAGEAVEESNSGAKKYRRDVDVDFVEQPSIQALLSCR